MPMQETDVKFMAKVMRVLTGNPTAADIDFLIQAHTKIGYLAAEAQAEAEFAYAVRKNAEATAWREAMNGEGKITAAAAERSAELAVWDLRQAEVKANERSKKISNLLSSVTEAINGIKFLGRMGG